MFEIKHGANKIMFGDGHIKFCYFGHKYQSFINILVTTLIFNALKQL